MTRINTNNKNEIVYKDLAYRVVGLAMNVHTQLGHGFLEKVYENSLMVLFKKDWILAEQQYQIAVNFEGEIVGNYIADILVGNKIILEIKSVEQIIGMHKAQALNYLKATQKRLAIILNFGKEKLEYVRVVL